MTPPHRCTAHAAWAAGLASILLAACASGPPVPGWQLNARAAAESAVDATLSGDAKAAERDLARARAEVARTGRPDLMARLELMHCAARVASLDMQPCDRFEALRADAAAPERAYADHLAGRATPAQLELLPPAQRAAARADDASAAGVLAAIDDPVARLLAAGVRMRQGRASPAVLALAVDTATARGWRRALIAWLQAAAARADGAGDATEAARLRRRIELVLQGP
jgi:hypothetical protein